MAARYLSDAELEAMIGDNDEVDDKDPDFHPNESEDDGTSSEDGKFDI